MTQAPLTQLFMAHRGKNYKKAATLVDRDKFYSLAEAVELLTKTSTTKFDASCEIHCNLNSDPRYADQIVRSTVVLPHGTGREVRVAVFAEGDKAKAALAAGAVKAGGEEFVDEVAKGFLDFDIAVATPDMMKSLGKIAKILGPKGMMPNPKVGTVTTDIENTVKELKAGKVEFKTDKFGILHNSFGKVSFGAEKLTENVHAFLKAVLAAKPSGIKGTYMKSISLATSMGPGVKVALQETLKELS